MAYSGYFFKWGDFTFPMKYIEWDSYDSAPNQEQSLDAYTDENGLTHDNVLSHTKTEIKFNTLPMRENEWKTLMENMTRNYIKGKRNANCVYWDMENCKYKTGHFYLDKSFRASANVGDNGKLIYNGTTWTFIEY